MLISDFCDYNNAYIVVKWRITVVVDTVDAKEKKINLTFKNDAPFISCISKINGIFKGNAEDSNIVMSMYRLLEYSENYSMISGGLWNYYRDEVNDAVNGNYRIS